MGFNLAFKGLITNVLQWCNMSCQVNESQAMRYVCRYGSKQTGAIGMTSEYASGTPRGPHAGTKPEISTLGQALR